MRVLVINSGSSSIKYEVIDTQTEQWVLRGVVEKIGEAGSGLRHTVRANGRDAETTSLAGPYRNHREGLTGLLELILDDQTKAIDAVGHRVVHGGEVFPEAALIDDSVIEEIRKLIPLAPLHNPPNLLGIELFKELLPETPQVAVFDTSFHLTIPAAAHRYAIPKRYYDEQRIRKYGMHGTSHAYVAGQAAKILDRDLSGLKIISLHLGNGCSVAAIDGGRSVETSMGLTPLEGLMMGTRCGDIDPAVPLLIGREQGLSYEELDHLLNRESGLLGICGVNDVREIASRAGAGDKEAKLALEMFVHRVKKYIGAYFAILGDADALVFTAGIGEHSALVREMICQGLEHMGFVMDFERNRELQEGSVRLDFGTSPAAILVIPTNEELAISQIVGDLLS